MGGPGTSSKDFTCKNISWPHHDFCTFFPQQLSWHYDFVLFFNDFFRDIMTFTLFQKTKEIEFSRVCLHFLSSAHTFDSPISNRAFSQDNWTLYPSLTHFNNMNVRCDIRTTKAHSIISQISNYEIYISNYFDIMQYSVEADLSFCRRDRLGAGAAAPCRQALHSQLRLDD